MKSVQIRCYFWSEFFCIRTEYGDVRSKSPYSVLIQKKTAERTSYLDSFHAVNVICNTDYIEDDMLMALLSTLNVMVLQICCHELFLRHCWLEQGVVCLYYRCDDLFYRSNKSGAIDVKLDGFVIEEKSCFEMLRFSFASRFYWDWYHYLLLKQCRFVLWSFFLLKILSIWFGALFQSMKMPSFLLIKAIYNWFNEVLSKSALYFYDLGANSLYGVSFSWSCGLSF